NYAEYGGAIESFNGKINNCIFDTNVAKEEGGALYSFYSKLTKNTFNGNKAEIGGDIYSIKNTV
ncbi:MAG: hypothetical protein Q4Q18_03785, partial [Methanobrevibacter sp.]|nr:hypothetical protein [Methanobrevibacter sp.]